MELQKNKVQLYSNQVFITDEVKNILPDFLTMLHGVVDSPDIPLNVSRSYLQEDGNVKKISGHITKKVADKLGSMYTNDRADFEQKWDDIGVFIQYGMLTEEKFYDKAKDFFLLKSTDDKYYTIEELKEAIKDTQKDKKGDTIVLYCTDRKEQHSFVQSANERGYVVVEMNSPLASHLMSHLERKFSQVQFKRVDSDVLDKLIEKEENLPGALSEEQKNTLKPIFESLVDTKTYHVQFENMSPNDAPFVITQNEFMRRMKEQSMMGGGGFYGTLPDTYNIVANTNHPLMEKLLSNNETAQISAKQAIDLALLAKGLLKGEDLTKFIATAVSRL
jgi:molecular chaperone HtpG